MATKTQLQHIAKQLRIDSLEMTSAAGSGHPTSCLSIVEIMSVLFFSQMRYSDNPKDPHNDQFVLSKGHAAPILYAALKRAGKIGDDLLKLRTFDSRLEGHPMPNAFPWAKVATGSLGQGLANGLGMALSAKLCGHKYTTYVLMGDSEIAEGSVYEAAQFGAYHKIDNLIAIVDVNRLGQRGPTMYQHNISAYEKRWKGFGWNVLTVDGHDVVSLEKAFAKAHAYKNSKPTIILAKTYKGAGVSFLENKDGWHGKALDKDELARALEELGTITIPKVTINKPLSCNGKMGRRGTGKITSSYALGEKRATREAYGSALVKLAKQNKRLVVVDAEVGNSTYGQKMESVDASRYIETFIAEQNMVGVAAGLAAMGHDVCAGTFAAFFTRAYDQIRMAGLSHLDLTFVGSHAGVSIGEDGPSQMGVEDLAMMRAVSNSSVFYPSDMVSAEKLIAQCVGRSGITYVRTSRPKTPVLYTDSEKFPVGGFKVHGNVKGAKVVLVGAGVTLHEALGAQQKLSDARVKSVVVDMYSVQPFDGRAFCALVAKCGKRVVVAEDHYCAGGLGEVVSHALVSCGLSGVAFSHKYVEHMSKSAPGSELLKYHKIDSSSIVREAKKLCKK